MRGIIRHMSPSKDLSLRDYELVSGPLSQAMGSRTPLKSPKMKYGESDQGQNGATDWTQPVFGGGQTASAAGIPRGRPGNSGKAGVSVELPADAAGFRFFPCRL